MATDTQALAVQIADGAEPVYDVGGGLRYITPGWTFRSITDKISGIVLRPGFPLGWLGAFGLGMALLGLFTGTVIFLLVEGVGIWGIDIPVAWAFAITSFVWWIGIGHAGTLISAILLLMHQKWRTSINRIAEAMTIFVVMCAGLFPLLHLGRPWFFYFLLPYPSTMQVWPQFRSALVWDVFAVSTYFLVSLIFWYQGMMPDLATLRDRARNRWARMAYGILAMGWRNSTRLFFMQLVFAYDQVDPSFPGTGIGEHWMDFLMPFGIGGLWLAAFLWVLRRTPALPEHDPNRERAAHFRKLDEEEAEREEAILYG